MTAADFRRIALSLTGAVEGAHMGHPDFRANARVFASLKADGSAGMVKLPVDEQTRFVRDHPAAFAPENGAWGRQGCTRVLLQAVDAEALGEGLTLAWQVAMASTPGGAGRRKPSRGKAPARAKAPSARKTSIRNRGR
jgi:hypothetical protein